jgi:hypothetical protein
LKPANQIGTQSDSSKKQKTFEYDEAKNTKYFLKQGTQPKHNFLADQNAHNHITPAFITHVAQLSNKKANQIKDAKNGKKLSAFGQIYKKYFGYEKNLYPKRAKQKGKSTKKIVAKWLSAYRQYYKIFWIAKMLYPLVTKANCKLGLYNRDDEI